MGWNEYLSKTRKAPPRPLLVEAVSFIKNKEEALDLGAGALNDTRHLLAVGFKKVTIVDSNPEVAKLAIEFPASSIEIHLEQFSEFAFSENIYDLVTAQYALPFNTPQTLPLVWKRLTNSLKRGGIFTGQFFGKEDAWANNLNMSFNSEDEIRNFLTPYLIQKLHEQKYLGRTAMGEEKYWHVFHIIAEKK